MRATGKALASTFLAGAALAFLPTLPVGVTSHVNPCAWIVSPLERQACMDRRGIPRPQQQTRADLPAFDPQRHCERIARALGSRSNAIRLSCLDTEQAAYDRLRIYWDRVPAETREHCIDVAYAAGREGSYDLLGSCLRMEIHDGREADR